MKNELVAAIFRDIARLLELKGENIFRIRAYERAAQVVEGLGEDIELLSRQNRLRELSGIGKDLEEKIRSIVSRGTCAQYETLKKEVPAGLLAMLDIPGLGPRTVKLFFDRLGIDDLEKLEKAARSGQLRKLEGIKARTEENVLKGIDLLKKGRERISLYSAREAADWFVRELKKISAVKKIEVAGSLRRKRETVKDIDILVTSSSPEKVINAFVALPRVREVIAKGETKASLISDEHDMQVDVRVVDDSEFGSALVYFTGSKQFNIKLRQKAIKKGLKINEYGVFSLDARGREKRQAGKSEKEVFKVLGLEYVPPEMREDRGEIELAEKKKLPRLVSGDDIRGEFHVHSTYSDGQATIKENALYAGNKGYTYLGIADHSQSLRVANGLDKKEVYRKIEEIRKVNRLLKNIRILCATEVDILKDGSLDYPNELLDEFDVVIAAVHSGFKQDSRQMTSRLVKACQNKRVHIIAHPSGRLYGSRNEYDFSFSELVKAAADNNVALEINCHPQRMDLNDVRCMQAAASGVKLAIGTDAHRVGDMDFMDLGLAIARRGWLEKKDLLNCLTIQEVTKWLKK